MVSAFQYHVTISRAQVKSSPRSRVFLTLTADKVQGFRLDRELKQGYYFKREGGEYMQKQNFSAYHIQGKITEC